MDWSTKENESDRILDSEQSDVISRLSSSLSTYSKRFDSGPETRPTSTNRIISLRLPAAQSKREQTCSHLVPSPVCKQSHAAREETDRRVHSFTDDSGKKNCCVTTADDHQLSFGLVISDTAQQSKGKGGLSD